MVLRRRPFIDIIRTSRNFDKSNEQCQAERVDELSSLQDNELAGSGELPSIYHIAL